MSLSKEKRQRLTQQCMGEWSTAFVTEGETPASELALEFLNKS